MSSDDKWDQRFLSLAAHVAEWSKDPSTQVGAVIVDGKRRILAVGYNGFPRGVLDSSDHYRDRDAKYPRVVHAELNAILNTGVPMALEGATLYCTLKPCAECAKAIIQTGIRRVVAPASGPGRWNESQDVACLMFAEAGVRQEWM